VVIAGRSASAGRSSRSVDGAKGASPVERDRQVAHTNTGCVAYGVRDRGGGADDADLPDALRTHRADEGIRLVEPIGLDRLDVGVGGDVVAGEVVVHDMAEARIDHALLMQSHRDPLRHAPDQLRASRLWVDDTPNVEDAE
jgi:hypothetical protein